MIDMYKVCERKNYIITSYNPEIVQLFVVFMCSHG